eukprot:TRINITY_DN24084_c0_g2_i1.p1 TRINITY_DN24084_c0_g2~~TRINITY_DN24084_c0_g2_i1.p1  ORF type:complete len:147 (-),score=35.94 TRINITY_DN24084_c0_g2_i1:317-757(-)
MSPRLVRALVPMTRNFRAGSVMQAPVQHMSAEVLVQMAAGDIPLELQGAQLVDVRESAELEAESFPKNAQTGEQLMSKHLPLSEFEDWSARVEEELERSLPVVVGCKAGVRSLQVCMWLDHAGFEHVFNLSGGLIAVTQHTANTTR